MQSDCMHWCADHSAVECVDHGTKVKCTDHSTNHCCTDNITNHCCTYYYCANTIYL